MVLGDSWVVISGVICRVTILLTHVRGLITTHEPQNPEPPKPLKRYKP